MLMLALLLLAQTTDVDVIPVYIPSRPFVVKELVTAPPKTPPLHVPFRVTTTYGVGRGSFMPRFGYETKPELIETRFQTVTINARANRWEAAGVFDLGTNFQHTSATSLTVRGVPVAIGGGRLTATGRYDSSSNQYLLFRGQDAHIAGHNGQHSLLGRIDLGIFHSEATWLGGTVFSGTTWTLDRIDLTVGSKTAPSPVDIALTTKTAYWGTGLDGGIRFKPIALTGSAFMYVTERRTDALPGETSAMLSGKLTYMVHKRAGVFVSGTWVLGFGRNTYSTIPLLNNRLSAGLATRLP